MRTVLVISICLIVSTLLACGRGKERLIEEKVAERVAEFKKKKTAECRVSLLEEAEKMVDSLLLHEALQEVTDSLARRLPFKPFKPVAIPPIDSAAVKPIFEQ